MRLHAMYLPQFHPIPENDRWWGRGFTEWTNTAKAKPLFRGHKQPRVPADLGFYDLRVSETRAAQADLARQYGIEGFVYYHYWFGGGKKLLQRPLEEVVASGQPDFPFSVCWANQTWTGVWHGSPKRVLVEQTYPSERDREEHFLYLLPAFRDRRYTRVNGKPIFMVFDPDKLPDPKGFTDHWRMLAKENGLPGLYFIANARSNDWDPHQHGYDASTSYGFPSLELPWVSKRQPLTWLLHQYRKRQRPVRYSYIDDIKYFLPTTARFDAPHLPTIIHAWDNTPRSGLRGLVIEDSSPDAFRPVLKRALEIAGGYPPNESFVFLKSWNEWAEGNYLEPDLETGLGFLQVIADELGI